MGNQNWQPQKKIISFENLAEQIAKCEQLGQRKCLIYGSLHRILYKGIQIQIGKSTGSQPNSQCLHYLIRPNILVLPPHCLLENYQLSKYERKKQLTELIKGVCDLVLSLGMDEAIGFSFNRIAYSQFVKKWTILGDISNGLWNYQYALKDHSKRGIYLSPELMIAFSKDKLYPKIDVKQSDVFIFAIMLLQIIAETDLQSEVFNFNSYQIKLGPILQNLLNIEEVFGKQIYEVFVKMLELQPQSRITFKQLQTQIIKIGQNLSEQCYLSPIIAKPNALTPPPNTKPKIDSFSPSPQVPKSSSNLNPVSSTVATNGDQSFSHVRGRSPGAIKKNLPLTDRDNKRPFSPIKPNEVTNISNATQPEESNGSLLCYEKKKRVSQGYKITPNKVKIWEGMEKERPKVEPFGLKFQQAHNQKDGENSSDQKSFTKLKTMRF